VIDKNYKIVSFNKIFSEKTKYSFNELKGKNFKKIIPNYENKSFVDFCELFCHKNCLIEKCFKDGNAQAVLKKGQGKNGEIYFHKIEIYPKKNSAGTIYEAVITVHDITQQKKAEEEVRRLNEFNERILHNAPVSIVVLDKKGEIISANGLAKKLMEKPNKILIGRKLIETKEIKKNPYLVKQYQALLGEGKIFYFDNLAYTPKNSKKRKHLNLIAVPLFGQDGQIEGGISMALDNTETILAKKNLENLNRQLEVKVMSRTKELDKINKKLSQAINLKSKFIADASHELRTPLTVIQGNLDLAIREAQQIENEPPETYSLILQEVERMTDILGDLTMLTNIDSGSEQLAYEEVDLGKLIIAVGQSLKILADQKKIALIYKKGAKNIKIYGDEAKLEKLLLNIVRNAIKYTESKGSVKMKVNSDGKKVLISVEDNGIGIPREDLPFIFERFYRVDKSRSRNEGGTGLGLSICKWITDAHGGYMSVDSGLGEGSAFNIYLPYDYRKDPLKNRLV